jgi:hypothetical protein
MVLFLKKMQKNVLYRVAPIEMIILCGVMKEVVDQTVLTACGMILWNEIWFLIVCKQKKIIL